MRTTIQMMLPKLGIAWMFALVTINFNYVAIYQMGIAAGLIGLMIGLYPFFGPFQPLFGRMTDRFPVWGYKRSPYLILGMLMGSMVFPPLPTVVLGMNQGSTVAFIIGFVLYFIFGLSIALMANTYLDLMAECTSEETRSGVFAAAWTGQTLVIVIWAVVFRVLMPTFSLASMQFLYNLTPFVVMAMAVASVVGLEKRLTPAEVIEWKVTVMQKKREAVNPLKESLGLLAGNHSAQMFFMFIALSFLGIFLQDLLQEVMGGEVFGMSVGETTVFQQIFNGTVTIGMALTAIFGAKFFKTSNAATTALLPMTIKKQIATTGGFGVVLTLLMISYAIYSHSLPMVYAAMALNGLTVGVFTFAAVTMMSDMTVEGQTGKYLGIWSLAQAVGLGSSFILSGVLHDAFVRSNLFGSAPAGYAAIFAVESGFMLCCVLSLRPASIEALRRDASKVKGLGKHEALA
jgi:BCD family chlorophyll transporter-like MFS transporter